VLALALSACQPKPNRPATDEPNPDKPFAEQPGADTPAADLEVVLSPLEPQVGVAVGTTLHYTFKSHGSVGYGANQRSSDETVVRYVRTDTAYEQSEADRAGKTGADAATGTFVFEAVAPGIATLTIEEVFRGTVEQSTTFTITVGE
jgi:hypothetical protein